MGMKLFDDNDSQNDDISKIEINKEYARRLEHNKKREDLQRYEELKKKGIIEELSGSDEETESESSSDEEDFNSTIVSKKKDLEFFDALIKVRNQDPSLKQKGIKLFESDDEQSSEEEKEEDAEQKGNRDKTAMYLKDVVAKQLIEEGPEFEEQDSAGEWKNKLKTYGEEQEELKRAFLDAAEVDDDDKGDFLRVKEKQNADDERKNISDNEFVRKMEEYFGKEGELDENKIFLKEYFMKKMWQDKERKGGEGVVDEEEVDELLRDEEEIERQEDYELEYNFRHEENAGDRVIGHSRMVEGSVRKKENTRMEQRKRKEERIKIANTERKEELKHLKNLKKEEINEKMRKVMEIAGIKEDEEFLLSSKDLEEEFDPKEYDKMMKAVFDEKYYDAEDEELGSDREDIEKPDFDKEDELLGLPKNWDVLDSSDGFLAARERTLERKLESGVDVDAEEEDEKEETEGEEEKVEAEEGKRKRKRKMSLVQKAKQEMLEEFYKLDYEDTIGDLKTRFKYAKIKPNRYGLKTTDILVMDDSELNQFVSLKKLAPYQDTEWKVPTNKRNHLRMRHRELMKGLKSVDQKSGKKRRRDNVEKPISTTVHKEGKNTEYEESNGDATNQSKSAKRRHRQKLNLSQGRLKAYGKISSKPKKNKEKH